jgi:hypothetical protein
MHKYNHFIALRGKIARKRNYLCRDYPCLLSAPFLIRFPVMLANFVRKHLGEDRFWRLKFFKEKIVKTFVKLCNSLGINLYPANSYYSPLPRISTLERNLTRWSKASELPGLRYDLEAIRSRFQALLDGHLTEYRGLISFEEARKAGFGPGYTYVDSITSFGLLRQLRPKRYLEVGSGMSTFYAEKAMALNAAEGFPGQITCIEPYPYDKLREIPGIQLIVKEVQDVPLEVFESLEAGDVFFIDSSHVLRIDSDVAFLYLEVLPRLKKGVYIHVHDIPFPYNSPYPTDHWILKRGFPMYWNEAMLLQAFLAFNHAFDIYLSTPLLRYHDEAYLMKGVPDYRGPQEEPNTFSSIWLQKVS